MYRLLTAEYMAFFFLDCILIPRYSYSYYERMKQNTKVFCDTVYNPTWRIVRQNDRI